MRNYYSCINKAFNRVMETSQPAPRIGTHDGVFHCDQVTACTLLTRYSHKFKGAAITRTRVEKLLDECDIIVDVGGKHQPPKYLDHHQRQFTKTHPAYPVTKLSSAGLVYWEFPELIPNLIEAVLSENNNLPFVPANNEEIQKRVRDEVYEKLILPIDGNDNGVESYTGGTKNYTVPSSIWSRVGRLNPSWYEEGVDSMARFRQAMDVADEELKHTVKSVFLGPMQTKEIIEGYFNLREKHDPSGEIVVLDKMLPWQKSLMEVEKEQNKEGLVKFVLYPEGNGKPNWRVQAMPAKEGGFELRKGLKQEWRGIKQLDKLQEISGIPDIVFVHMNGFIGGAQSFDSTLKMALLSLQAP